MSEYGSGITLGRMAALDKERIRHALRGELMTGEDEHGLTYADAPREECERYILDAFDNMVYHCKELAASGCAMERVLKDRGIDMASIMTIYMTYLMDEKSKHQDYVYECEVREFMSELEGYE